MPGVFIVVIYLFWYIFFAAVDRLTQVFGRKIIMFYKRSYYKVSHLGFFVFISAFFLLRFHPLISFSLLIASSILV